MQDVKAPVTAPSRSTLTATAALLCFLSAPVLAAAGLDVLCDKSADHVDTHAIDHLSIDTVEHSLTNRITSEQPLGGAEEDVRELLPMAPREEEILRRIFDEPASEYVTESSSSSEDGDEADTPLIEERSADVADTDLIDQDAADTLLPGIRLPDATPEETRRYRRQMFRTDI